MRVTVWAVVILFLCMVSGVVVLSIAAPESSAIELLIASLPPTIGTIVVLGKQVDTATRVEAVDEKVDKVLNGVMDKKIQDNARIVRDEQDNISTAYAHALETGEAVEVDGVTITPNVTEL